MYKYYFFYYGLFYFFLISFFVIYPNNEYKSFVNYINFDIIIIHKIRLIYLYNIPNSVKILFVYIKALKKCKECIIISLSKSLSTRQHIAFCKNQSFIIIFLSSFY